MKKIFFCIFSTLFIILCVFLGLSTETYAVFLDADGVTFTDKIIVNDNNPETILNALSTFSFTYNNTQYLEWSDITSVDYIFSQSNYNDDSYIKADSVVDAFPNGCTISYSETWQGNNYYRFDATPYVHIQLNNQNTQNKNYPITLSVTYWYNPNGDWYSRALPNNEHHRLFSNFDFTYTPPNDSSVDFEGSLGSGSGGSGEEEEEDKTILETIQDFFANFGDNLVHIVVPSQEDMEELQESFEENILDKFAISSISRSSTYDNNSLYPLEYENHKPVFIIYGYEFQSSMITDFMNTPISFGKLQNYQSTTEHSTEISTGGLTPFTIINLMFGISITAFNIIMFNKFFEKE